MQLKFIGLTKNKKDAIYSLIIILFCVISIFQKHKNYFLKKELKDCEEYYYSQVYGMIERLMDDNKDYAKHDVKLVVIFSPEDCEVCIKEISSLWSFVKENTNIGFYGLINHPYPDLVKRFMKTKNWLFPYKIINNNLYGNGFGFEVTPVKILIRNERVVYIEGALSDWEKEGRVKDYIRTIVDN